MLQRLGVAQFLGCLIDHIESRTGHPCYDDPNNRASPLYSVQVSRVEPVDTKTMFADSYEVWVHCIAEPTVPYSNAPVLALVESLEEAMTEEVELPEPFQLLLQSYGGMQTLKQDESHEGHAVLVYTFRVCYGFRCK